MTTPGQIVRIFISSPGDVAAERDKARRVIEGLQRHYSGVTLLPVLWEDLALPATASFQANIDCILHQQPIDVAVFILWSRLGSPLGAGITRPDGTLYHGGTEREFDLMLTAFEQSGKQRPIILAYARTDEAGFRQSLADCPGPGLEELINQRRLAESFIRKQFYDVEGHNLRAVHTYREPVSFAQQLHTHLRQVLDELLGGDAAPRWLEAPYRGLESFETAHAAIFHGRDEEICDLLQRLRDQQQAGCAFAVIVGASGSGKSSLARAGVAAALTHHAYDDQTREWRIATFIPGLSDGNLGAGLTCAMTERLPELRSSATALDDIARGFVQDAALTVKLSIIPAFARAAEKAGGDVRVLLVLDQMEELWTDRRISAGDREIFLNVIEALSRCGHVAVLATLRSDFYPQAQASRAFLRLKGERGHCDLLPPGSAALQRIIIEPARLAGLRFERDERTSRTLDEVILQDASRDSAALPLLQYTLSELYGRRNDGSRTLTFAAYEQLGGVEGALGRRAAEIFRSLPADARAALPEILSLLVTLDTAGEQAAIRRRAPLADLTKTPARRALTESLIAARFLTTDRQLDTAVASLAHEALLRRWNQVAEWVRENREQLWLRAHVEQNQQRWEQQGRDPSLLLPPGLPLEEGRQLLAAGAGMLLSETTAYISASLMHHEQEAVRRRRRRRAVLAAMSLLTLLAILGGSVAWIKQREADAERNTATQAQHRAEELLRATRIQLARSYLQHGLGEESAGRIETMRRDLNQAWALTPDDDPLHAACERILIDRLTRNGRATGLVLRHGLAVRAIAFSPHGERMATGSSDKTARLWDARTGAPLGAPLRHDDAVYAVAFSPDGTSLATGSNDKTARLWALSDGRPLGKPMQHDDEVNAVAFSPDGTLLITCSNDNTARLWDAHNGAPLTAPLQHKSWVVAAAFSPDGARVVTGSNDETARLWNTRTGAPLGEPLRHDSSVGAVAFNSAGTLVITGSSDKTARLWDAHTGQALGEPLRHDDFVNVVAFSPDGGTVVTGSWKAARLWDAQNGAPRGEVMRHDGWVDAVAFSPDGKRVITGSGDKTARVWDAQSGTLCGEPLRHDEGVGAVAFSPDGARVLTGSQDGTAQLWFAENTAPLVGSLHHDQPVTSIALSRDGTRIVTGSNDNTARLWDASAGVSLGEPLRHDGPVAAVAFSPDGSRILTASWDNTARLWDATNSAPLGEKLLHDGWIVTAAFSPDGTRIATGSKDKTARLWDARSGAALGEPLRHDEELNAVAFSPDGQRLLTGSGKTARLWDARSGAALGKPMPHTGAVVAVGFSPDGARVATGSWDYTARLWDAHTGAPLGEPMPHDEFVVSLAFSPDGSRVVTGSWDKTARLWDARSGAPLGEPMRHDSTVHAVAFSPDGTRVVSGSSENSARVWDACTGAPLGEPLPHGDWVAAVAFSSNGSRLVTGSGDNTARVWDTGAVPIPRDIQTWIEFQSGYSTNESQVFKRLSFEDLEQRLEALRQDTEYFDRLTQWNETWTRRIRDSVSKPAAR